MTPPSPSSPNEESSVLFSLNELMDLENDRIADEEAERAEIMRAEQRARAQEEERKRKEERLRLEQLEEQRRSAELRKREEAVRLDAIAQAELAKVQYEAHAQAQRAAMAQSQEHEQRLTELKQDESKKKLRIWLGVSVAAAVMVGVGGGLWVRETTHQAEQEQARLAQEAQQKKQAFDDEMAALREKMNLLGAKDAESRRLLREKIAQLEKERAAETKSKKPTEKPGRKINKPERPVAPPPTEICFDGDPMCDRLAAP